MLQVHDFLLSQDLPELNTQLYMISIRPCGERNIVISGMGKTSARNSHGFYKNSNF
jgi:hypothetical protein